MKLGIFYELRRILKVMGWKGESDKMDRGRMKLRICLTCAVLLAVAAGVIYYCFYMPDAGELISEGTLVRGCSNICDSDMETYL